MQQPVEILFVCTHNRCRSILGEVLANENYNGFFRAYSAGSQPAGEIHPLTLHYLKARSLPTEGLQSQSWDEFDDHDFDWVITVCDSAAAEPCPLWMTEANRLHWSMRDPSKQEGDDKAVEGAFFEVMDALDQKLLELKQALS